MTEQLTQGQQQLQQALEESASQQTQATARMAQAFQASMDQQLKIHQNVEKSIDVRDRSELNGIPKPDKFSHQFCDEFRWAAAVHLYSIFETFIQKGQKHVMMLLTLLFSFYIGDALSFPCDLWIEYRRLPWLRELNLDTKFRRLIEELPPKRAKKWRAKPLMSICTGKASLISLSWRPDRGWKMKCPSLILRRPRLSQPQSSP